MNRHERMSPTESMLRLASVMLGFALGDWLGGDGIEAESLGAMCMGAFALWVCARFFWRRPI